MKSNCVLLFFKNSIHNITRTNGILVILFLRKVFISNPYIMYILISVVLDIIISESGIIIIIILRELFISNPYIIYIIICIVIDSIISDSGITIVFTSLFVTMDHFMIVKSCLWGFIFSFFSAIICTCSLSLSTADCCSISLSLLTILLL